MTSNFSNMDLFSTDLDVNQVQQSEFFANSGICKKVFTTVRYSPNGDPYINALLDIGNGKEKIFLICLSEQSDFNIENSLLLQGQQVILQRKSTNDLYIKYFSCLPNKTKEYILENTEKKTEEVVNENKEISDDKNTLLERLSKEDLVMIIQSLRTLLFIPFDK